MIDPAGSGSEVGTWLSDGLTGAYGRGVADGIEMLGVGALLIDGSGLVLAVGARGSRLMAGWLRIVAGHLVAERSDDGRALAALVATALAGRPSPSGIRLRAGPGEPVLILRAVAMSRQGDAASGPQAAIILDEA